MAGIVTIQGKITTTGVAQQLPSKGKTFSKTFTLTAKSTNTAAIGVTVGNNGGAVDGTGTGYILEKGQSINLPGLTATEAIWLTGTAADIYSAVGT